MVEKARELVVIGVSPVADDVTAVFRAAGWKVEVATHDSIRVDRDLIRTALGTADLVIEAVHADLERKAAVLADLGDYIGPAAVVVTASGAHTVGLLTTGCPYPERVVGMQWWQAKEGPLVELLPGASSDPQTIARARDLLARSGCEVVVCRVEAPGGIAQRLTLAMVIESLRLVAEGVSSVTDLDRVAKGMYRHARGPFEVLQDSGVLTVLEEAAALARHYGGDRFAAVLSPADVLNVLTDVGGAIGVEQIVRADVTRSTDQERE